jgi:hypothetical protein
MWRAFFLALGAFAILLGAQCLAIEKAVMGAAVEEQGGGLSLSNPFGEAKKKELAPPEWAPWTLMSAGAVTIIYSFTLPKRGAK